MDLADPVVLHSNTPVQVNLVTQKNACEIYWMITGAIITSIRKIVRQIVTRRSPL